MAIAAALVLVASPQQLRRGKLVHAVDADERPGVCEFRQLDEASQARMVALEFVREVQRADASGVLAHREDWMVPRLRAGLRFCGGRVVAG